MTNLAIAANKLRKAYKDKIVLDGINRIQMPRADGAEPAQSTVQAPRTVRL